MTFSDAAWRRGQAIGWSCTSRHFRSREFSLIWWNLSKMALIAGSIWMLAGVAYGAVKTRGFRAELVDFDVPNE